jgi:hypothetical protein
LSKFEALWNVTSSLSHCVNLFGLLFILQSGERHPQSAVTAHNVSAVTHHAWRLPSPSVAPGYDMTIGIGTHLRLHMSLRILVKSPLQNLSESGQCANDIRTV